MKNIFFILILLSFNIGFSSVTSGDLVPFIDEDVLERKEIEEKYTYDFVFKKINSLNNTITNFEETSYQNFLKTIPKNLPFEFNENDFLEIKRGLLSHRIKLKELNELLSQTEDVFERKQIYDEVQNLFNDYGQANYIVKRFEGLKKAFDFYEVYSVYDEIIKTYDLSSNQKIKNKLDLSFEKYQNSKQKFNEINSNNDLTNVYLEAKESLILAVRQLKIIKNEIISELGIESRLELIFYDCEILTNNNNEYIFNSSNNQTTICVLRGSEGINSYELKVDSYELVFKEEVPTQTTIKCKKPGICSVSKREGVIPEGYAKVINFKSVEDYFYRKEYIEQNNNDRLIFNSINRDKNIKLINNVCVQAKLKTGSESSACADFFDLVEKFK